MCEKVSLSPGVCVCVRACVCVCGGGGRGGDVLVVFKGPWGMREGVCT